MSDTPFSGLRVGSYGALLVDPPWAFRTYSGIDTTPHRTAIDPYRTMPFAAIRSLPVGSLAARDCALFLWVVDSHLDVAFPLAEAWGFKYKTRVFEWLKTTKDGKGYRINLGYWSRKQCESVLLFTRGKPHRLNADVRQIIEAPIREHSRKPDDTYDRIERLVAGPYCELFATRYHRGWDGWGNRYPVAAAERRRMTEAVGAEWH